MLVKWIKLFFPHWRRSDGKGGVEVVVQRWETSVLIIAVY